MQNATDNAIMDMSDLLPEQADMVEDLLDYDGLDYVTARYVVENY